MNPIRRYSILPPQVSSSSSVQRTSVPEIGSIPNGGTLSSARNAGLVPAGAKALEDFRGELLEGISRAGAGGELEDCPGACGCLLQRPARDDLGAEDRVA